MYRPEGWDTEVITKENMPMFAWGTQEYAQVMRGVEIGADVMLEGLRISGLRFPRVKLAGNYFEPDGEKEWGHRVFIPEEK